MAGIGQYLKDTQGELRHVAWPTNTQTIVYTVLVAVISVVIALYLGFFDYLFTSGLARVIGAAPEAQQQSGIEIEQLPATSTELNQDTTAPSFDITTQ